MTEPGQHGMGEGEEQVAWLRTPYRAPIYDRDGAEFGTAESLLGDEESDIFHGLAVKPAHGGPLRELKADNIAKITTVAVYTDLTAADADQLPPYQEERWFHLGEGGLFRKRPEWRKG